MKDARALTRQQISVPYRCAKALETLQLRNAKLISDPLEAKVHLKAGEDLYGLLDTYEDELADLFLGAEENDATFGARISVGDSVGESVGLRVG